MIICNYLFQIGDIRGACIFLCSPIFDYCNLGRPLVLDPLLSAPQSVLLFMSIYMSAIEYQAGFQRYNSYELGHARFGKTTPGQDRAGDLQRVRLTSQPLDHRCSERYRRERCFRLGRALAPAKA